MIEKLSKRNVAFYKVKRGQTLAEIAAYFNLPTPLLVKENALKTSPRQGEILKIPHVKGNLYTAQAGEGKTLLCGDEKNYAQRNGTQILYPGLKVLL